MYGVKDKSQKQCHTDDRQMIDEVHASHLSKINSECDLAEYYLDNGLLLDSYYKSQNKTDTQRTGSEGGILGIFNKHVSSDTSIQEEPTQSKQNVISSYLSNVDDNYMNDSFQEYQYDICSCGGKMTMSYQEGNLLCPQCGFTKNILIESERGAYNDPPKESNYFAYKRINHFNEWLAQFQAKETTEIPENVYKDVHSELKKDMFIDWKDLKYEHIRGILKKLKYNKYYEQIPHIVNVLSGKGGGVIDRTMEETLRSLFKEIQIPFIRNCPAHRKNFLSYSYVLHKFCELLGYDDLLKFFPLLKSREKLQQQDRIWKLICSDLQWEYIPST